MNRNQVDENGEDLRQQIVLKLDSGRRSSITATVALTALDDHQQARFDAEVENLLMHLVQQQVEQEK